MTVILISGSVNGYNGAAIANITDEILNTTTIPLMDSNTGYFEEDGLRKLAQRLSDVIQIQPLIMHDPDDWVIWKVPSYGPMFGKQGLLFRYDPKKVHDQIKPRNGFSKKRYSRKSFPKTALNFR